MDTSTPLRILTVGLRQFRRPDTNHPTWQKPWDWHTMLKLPGLHPERTKIAWDRLHDIGLKITTAVDLLPPGGDFRNEQAIDAANYLRGIVDGLNFADETAGTDLGYDMIVLLGGRVADAFCSGDARLYDMRLLSPRSLGTFDVVILPSPHTNETTGEGWWSSPDKQQALRDAVAEWVQVTGYIIANLYRPEAPVSKLSIIRAGDVVRVVDPRIVLRVGYPKSPAIWPTSWRKG